MKTILFTIAPILTLGSITTACVHNTTHPLQTGEESIMADSILVTDIDSAPSRKSLNDMRFGNWTKEDHWVDNPYVDELRTQLDIMAKEGDKAIPFAKNRFAILQCDPYIMGGLLITIVFEHHLDKPYDAWIYSGVNEETETVTNYEVRFICENEEINKEQPVTEDGLREYMKKCPYIKWK